MSTSSSPSFLFQTGDTYIQVIKKNSEDETSIINGDNQYENHIGSNNDSMAKKIIDDVGECYIGNGD